MQFITENELKVNNNNCFNNCEQNYDKLRKKVKMLLTVKETAEVLKIAESTLYRWVHQKKINYIKLGGLKFDEDYIQEYIKQHTVNSE